ncbi:MAG: NtaA/DmoA family FMN-dependent monooxygenase [Acidimicrobiia bacterium]|nr:NtaA/DmoA family FMN-dependent monooxygenase [Acidimicrobiia bacterium]
MPMSALMHLAQFAIHGPTDHSLATWRHPRTERPYRWDRPQLYESIAATCERGKLDMLFFADFNILLDLYQGSFAPAVRRAVQTPTHDPVPLAAWLGARTSRLGLGVTFSVSQQHPYYVARLFATLDHMTAGRIGWNVVTTANRHETLVGYDEVRGHDGRYDRADEFLDVCRGLWRSWEPDAVVEDVDAGVFADPSRVHPIDHAGEYFRSRGPLNVTRSPQTGPAIIQAGASERGRAFAGRHAEAIFAIGRDASDAAVYYDRVKSEVVDSGRDPDSCKVLFGLQPFVAPTESLARERLEEHNELVPLEGGLTILSGHLGRDFSQDDPDAPLPHFEAGGSHGILAMYESGDRPAPTLAEVAIWHGRSVGLPQVAGTAEQVADWLEAYLATAGGDGFMLSAYHAHGAVAEFVDLVVPVLQERGQFRREYTGTTLREHLRQTTPG